MNLRHVLPAAALVAALALTPAPAFAQTDTTTTAPSRPPRQRPRAEQPRAEQREQRVERIKARCLAAIDRRQRALETQRRRLAEAKALTEEHRAGLARINEATSNGLAGLADQIQAEDNREELRAECQRIVDDFRVFALVRPRARLVLASDRALSAVTRLTGVAADIQAAIDDAKADGRDTSEAEAQLATMRDATAAAQAKASGVYDAVIELTPADYNAHHDLLAAPRDALKTARESIRAAVKAGRAATQELRSDPDAPASDA